MVAQTLTPQELDRLIDTQPLSTGLPVRLDSPFLRQLATAGRDVLDELITEQQYQQGEVILQEGEIGQAMYIIWSGRVAVVKGNLASPIVLGYRGPGEIIGEMALLEDEPRSASIIALENMRLLRISREDFSQLLSRNPSVGMGILGTLSARLRAADDARGAGLRAEDRLSQQVSELQSEKQQLLELQQLRQETTDLIVHDLRHPISSLFGIIKLLEMVLPAEALAANQSLLNLANSTCEHMQLLVDSLLDIARMESGEVDLYLEELDLKRLIQEAVNRPVTPTQENVSLRATLPPDLPPVVADEEKIHRVLANLIGNAVKYTPAGGKIVVAARRRKEQVRVSVTDTGPGIPPEDRERIFERFAQVSEDNARGRGFGLGLAFCRLAVEAHGGKIWVEPGEGSRGSRFIFTLPLNAAEN
ncbi:MAG: cyclic nucleotide-binding domain-containing protein [Anaerolineae bacterium]|nr:cyclic nucleotide-binding domain-containing protein [Anaerolineae bacterium]